MGRDDWMIPGEETENLTVFVLVALRICCFLGSAISCNSDACSQCEYKFLRNLLFQFLADVSTYVND